MKIVFNGEPCEVKAATLPEILEELGFGGAKIATALNGEFVPIAAREDTAVGEGDHLEVVAPMQGG